MNTVFNYFVLVIIGIMIWSCKYEDKLVQQLEGRWRWISLTAPPAAHIGINDSTKHFFKFLPCKRAYTSKCRCVYTIEKKNLNQSSLHDTTLADTILYDLKKNELSITSFLTNNTNPNSNQNGILLDRRFKVILDDENLELRNAIQPENRILLVKH